MEVVSNPALQNVSLSKAHTFDGGGLVQNNKVLTTLELSATTVGRDTAGRSISLVDNNALVSVQTSVTTMQGSLAVKGNAALQDLTGFNNTRSIGRAVNGASLEVTANTELTNFKGLEHVVSMSGSLEVQNNPSLTSMQGLNNVESIGKDEAGRSIAIANNNKLQSLSGLESVSSTEGGVAVVANMAITSLSGLGAVQSVGATKAGKSLEIVDNAMLTSLIPSIQAFLSGDSDLDSVLSSLEKAKPSEATTTTTTTASTTALPPTAQLTTLQGSVTVTQNPRLQTTEGLDALANIGKDADSASLVFTQNTALSTVNMNLNANVAGSIEITQSPNLTMVTGFSKVSSVGKNSLGQSVVIADTQLSSLSMLSGVDRPLAGSVLVLNNSKLTSLSGLEGVTSIGKDNSGIGLQVSHNVELHSLAGLASLSETKGSVAIEANAKLESFSGMDNLETIGSADLAGDALRVSNNAQLQNVSALSKLRGRLSGAISISHNTKLQSLDGLSGVNGVGANLVSNSLEIVANAELKSLGGLKGLEGELPAAIVIQDNPKLLDLHGLEKITSVKAHDRANASIVLMNNKVLVDLDGIKNLGGNLTGALVVKNNTNLVSIEGLKGDHPIRRSTQVEVTDAKCISADDAQYLQHLCAGVGCAANDIEAAKACSRECRANYDDDHNNDSHNDHDHDHDRNHDNHDNNIARLVWKADEGY
eukprot:g1193.t1